MKPHHKYAYVLSLKENQKKENYPSAQPVSLVLCPATHMWCLMQVRYLGGDREAIIFVLTIYKNYNQAGRDATLAAMESIHLRWNCPYNWAFICLEFICFAHLNCLCPDEQCLWLAVYTSQKYTIEKTWGETFLVHEKAMSYIICGVYDFSELGN